MKSLKPSAEKESLVSRAPDKQHHSSTLAHLRPEGLKKDRANGILKG